MQAESAPTTCRPRKKRKSNIDDHGATTKPRNERNARGGKRGKLVLGLLIGLLEMPVDILHEIFGHLRPQDLLSLSRVTKEFRAFILGRSSSSIWTNVFSNVPGVPRHPPDMTAPRWASLLYDQYCGECLRLVRTVDWRLRVRLCTACVTSFTKSYSLRIPTDTIDGFSVYFEDLIPTRPATKRRQYAYLTSAYNEVKSRYIALDGSASRLAFVEERKSIVKKILKHATECEVWARAQVFDRSEELQAIKDRRKARIVEKLTSLGYGHELDHIAPRDRLELHKLVKQPQELTERIWANIESQMIEYMEEMKEKRLAREHKAVVIQRQVHAISVLRAYKLSTQSSDIMPEPVDFCSFPAIRAILEQPVEVDVNESSFNNTLSLLPSIIDTWRARINVQLWQKYQGRPLDKLLDLESSCVESDELQSDKMTRLRLATTVFKCHSCQWSLYCQFTGVNSVIAEPLFYPKVLGHRCLTKGDPDWDDYSHDSARRLATGEQRRKWNCNVLGIDAQASKLAGGVLKACGLDPETTTAEDMDKLDTELRIGCESCAKTDIHGGTMLFTFGWRSAIKHNVEKHSDIVGAWRKLSPKETSEALLMERLVVEEVKVNIAVGDLSHVNPSDFIIWICTHCRDLPSEQPPMEIDELKAHCLETHKISDPLIGRDYCKDFAAPQLYANTAPFQIGAICLDVRQDLTEL